MKATTNWMLMLSNAVIQKHYQDQERLERLQTIHEGRRLVHRMMKDLHLNR